MEGKEGGVELFVDDWLGDWDIIGGTGWVWRVGHEPFGCLTHSQDGLFDLAACALGWELVFKGFVVPEPETAVFDIVHEIRAVG